jgi:hypothetical protein
MNFSKYPKPLQEAIREIAYDAAHQPIQSEITAQDAEDHAADDDVLMAFWSMQQAVGDAAETWFDVYEKLTDDERTQVVAAIVMHHPAGLKVLREALVAHVSEWLATQADKYRDDPDHFHRRDPDDYGDWLYEQRKQDRLDAMVSP